MTVENELPKSGSGISSETLPLSKSGVSSVVVFIGAFVGGAFGCDGFDNDNAELLLVCKNKSMFQRLLCDMNSLGT